MAGQARGPSTRERLIAAAVDMFGRKGFDGVGARELSSSAGAALAAIPHHFGTMEALYRAALQRVREELGAALAPAAERARAGLDGCPDDARRALAQLQADLLDVIVVRPEAETWAKLLLREHFDPGPAFDIVYQGAALGVIELMAALIARDTGRAAEEPRVLIEAFARMGEVLIFRTVRFAAARRLGWTTVGRDEAAMIADVLAEAHRAKPVEHHGEKVR
jgi:AcrR family transcriptional regulator